jgi:ABC-type nickel/cobalt efflux system permease component RcnA
VPPPPSPPHHIVIIVVFVSFGGLLLLGCLAAFFCWHKKKGRKRETKAEVLNYSDHVHVHKETMSGPHGADVVKLSIDEDVKFQEAVKKQDSIGESSSAAAAGKTAHHLPWTWHKKHESKEEKKAELINVTKHKHIDEKIVPGPHGEQIEVLSEDEDIRFEDAGQKEEEFEKSKVHIRKS